MHLATDPDIMKKTGKSLSKYTVCVNKHACRTSVWIRAANDYTDASWNSLSIERYYALLLKT